MQLPVPALLLALGPSLALAASAAHAAAPVDPTYTALRAARPAGEGVAVANVVLTRDAHRLTLAKGTVFFLSPVEGRVTGAVFVGQGAYELTPATETERRHLAVVTGDKALARLEDTFDSAVLFFTDGTADELKSKGTAAGAASATEAGAVLDAHMKRQRKDFRTNFHLRVLEDLANGGAAADPGLFLASFKGKRASPALAGFDPLGADRIGLMTHLGGEESFLYVADETRGGFWYLSPSVEKCKRGEPTHDAPPVLALHYAVTTSVEPGAILDGETTIRLAALKPVRAIRLNLLSKLRISDVSVSPAEGTPAFRGAAFVQEAPEEDSDVEVVLPEPLAPGGRVLLRVRYRGKEVLRDAGQGNFVVGARESWYANLGVFTDPTPFDLTYRVPKANEVVSVGTKVEDRVEGELRVTRWEAKQPIRVAGFNYGVFKRLEEKDKDSAFTITVLTNPGTPDVIAEINQALSQGASFDGGSDIPEGIESSALHINPNFGNRAVSVDTEQLAQSALADGINAARVLTKTFGPIATKSVAITQQSQWSFGQSWPSLVFMPYIAFLDGGTRRNLGLGGTQEFVDLVGYHEMAHQWWGHAVGWESYRDVWLSEGFAEFSAALTLQHAAGMGAYRKFWERARRRLVEKRGGAAAVDAGPLSLGFRLETSRTPGAYGLVYTKGAFVLHMLRMLMQDTASKTPDAPFEAMMKDFVARFSGKNPSTADFQSVVERHMRDAMNATGDGKMSWFFRQWVYGTEVPVIAAKLDAREVSKGRYAITGTITQSGVSPEFRALVPLYVELKDGRLIRFGTAPLVGSRTLPVNAEIGLPEKPKKVLANALYDVLAKDK